jgi:hypothetical protein
MKNSISVCIGTNFKNIKGEWTVCEICAMEVFLCQTTIEAQAVNRFGRNDFSVVCLDCAQPLMDTVKSFPDMTEGQIREQMNIWNISREEVLKMHERRKMEVFLNGRYK